MADFFLTALIHVLGGDTNMQSVTAAVDEFLPNGDYIFDTFNVTSKYHILALNRNQILSTYSMLRKILMASLVSFKINSHRVIL